MKAIKKEIRNKVIFADLPDGRNFFIGVHEAPFKKEGVSMGIMTNIWDDFSVITEGRGLFTETEAKFYLEKIVNMDGCFISEYDTQKKIYAEKQIAKSN
jgi:hypothetical protein